MTKVTELPFIGTASPNTSFIIVDNKLTRRINYNILLTQLRNEIARFDQALYTTSSVTFASITATMISATTLSLVSGAVVDKLSVGNQPLNTFSANLFVSNYTANERSTIILRGYRDNFPSPNSFFSRPDFHAEYGRGSTSTVVSAVLSGDTLGGFSVGGYDGSKWSSDRDFNTGEMIFRASENWAGNATTATNAGTMWYLRSQIPGVPLAPPSAGYNQTHIYQYWSTNSTSSVVNSNLGFGGGSDGVTPTIRKSDGTSYLGYGSTNLYFINPKFNIYGTVREDSAPDNESLPDSSKITLVGNRGSGVFLRRRAVIANDTLGRLEFHGNDGSSTTSAGSHGGELAYTAIDNFSTTKRGTKILLTSINSGTIIESTRLDLKNLENIYSSDVHSFKPANNSATIVTITTNSFVVSNRLDLKNTENIYSSNVHSFKTANNSATIVTITTNSFVVSNRLDLKNLENIYSSDVHSFKTANSATIVTITTNSFFVKSVRAISTSTVPTGFSPMYYNTLTGELIVVY